MKVGYSFSSIRTVVNDDSVPIVQLQFICYLASDEQEMAEQSSIRFRRFSYAWYRFLGNDQYMGWRLGVNVADCHAQVVLVLEVARYFPVGDFLEKRFFGIHFITGCQKMIRDSFEEGRDRWLQKSRANRMASS